MASIYFTDFFDVDPDVLEEYGAFNVSLINDLPLFIDPFLLFDSKNASYQALHAEIVAYVKFLRDRSLDTKDEGLLEHWFMFPEVKQNWLGFSKQGNGGTGLGNDFAISLRRNLAAAFRDFGSETVSRGSHLEKLCLIDDGVGRDHLSDFATNLIKHHLLDYTQRFAREHVTAEHRGVHAVGKVRFDYETRRWSGAKYELPTSNGDFVILTPKDILTKDEAWINRSDLVNRFQDIFPSISDAQLRHQISAHFMNQLDEDPPAKELREAARKTIETYPAVLDHYVRSKEDSAPEAHRTSSLKVRETEEQFIRAIKALVDAHLSGTDFYRRGSSFDEALARVYFLKDVIENKDGYRIFYVKGKPLKREADLQVMYRLTWFATDVDVNREVNNGRGPVDFKASRGRADAVLVEFKLASNSKLKQNLKHQVGVYEAASDTAKSIKVVLYFTAEELSRTREILKELGLDSRRDVVLIDARGDNKPSASNVRD